MEEFMEEVIGVIRMHFETNIESDKTRGHNLQIWDEQCRNVFNRLRAAVKPTEEMDALVERLRLKKGGY